MEEQIRSRNILFVVVQFPEEDGSLFVVPLTWIQSTSSGTSCRWPPVGMSAKKASKNRILPTDEWGTFNAVPVHYSRSYKSANKYLNKSRYSSEVEVFSSDADIPAKKHCASSSSSWKTSNMETIFEEGSANAGPSKQDFNRLEAKVDLLLKYIVQVKEDTRENKEELLKNLKNDQIQALDFATQNFKSLETLQEIEDFEALLHSDEEFAKAIKKCGYIGGKDFKDAVRRILSTIFTHEMALNMSWSAANKISIKRYPNLLLFITVALRSNKEYKEIPSMQIEDVIKRWFRYAPDRNGGRMERLKKMYLHSI